MKMIIEMKILIIFQSLKIKKIGMNINMDKSKEKLI